MSQYLRLVCPADRAPKAYIQRRRKKRKEEREEERERKKGRKKGRQRN